MRMRSQASRTVSPSSSFASTRSPASGEIPAAPSVVATPTPSSNQHRMPYNVSSTGGSILHGIRTKGARVMTSTEIPAGIDGHRFCCTVQVDRVGNIFARRPGAEDHLPPVLMGSHLDTQFAGGKYDGIIGVLAGLEVLRTLDDRRLRTKRPLELVCWTNEEGARFTPPMVASGAFAGVFEVDWVLGLRDDDGKVFGRELERIGYNGKTPVGGRGIDSYFELHIEQGPILERETVPVGIVVGGYAT